MAMLGAISGMILVVGIAVTYFFSSALVVWYRVGRRLWNCALFMKGIVCPYGMAK